MTDTFETAAGAGGIVFASDDIGGVHYEILKIAYGALDAATIVSATNGLPVAMQGTWTVGLSAGTNAIGKLTANSGVDIGDVDILSIAAGDNNIGNVDIVTLPAGNLGMQLMAASLSVVPASNITDATYIGDIKFGEALPAGTNNIGDVDVLTIAAGDNNIGNVDIVSFPAGNLGMQLMTASLSIVPASNITDATYIGDIKFGESLPAGTNNIGDVDILSIAAGDNNIGNVDVLTIAAGDNNIGNVDIVTLPAGNLGQQAMAASLSTVPASNITDATYIGDIKFGESLPAGTNGIGKLTANSGVDIGDVDVLSIAAGANLIGNVDITPRTTGGWSVANFTSGDTYTALTNSAQVIKASAGKFGGYYIYNPNATAAYVLVYNIAAASVTVGTSTALLVFCIPATSGANLELLAGIAFGTAMSCAAATTGGGNTAPTTALEAMIFYT